MLKIGQLVIINHFDAPCSRLIALVLKIEKHRITAIYLAKDIKMIECWSSPENVTPIESFGVRIEFSESQYRTVQIAESTATYRDGKIRKWQPHNCAEWITLKPKLKGRFLCQ